MEKCPDCGTELTKEMLQVNMCFECGYIIDKSLFEVDETGHKDGDENSVPYEIWQTKLKLQKEKEELRLNERVSNYMITTGFSFEGYRIVTYHGLFSGDVVMGTGAFADIAAGFSDLFGIESNTYASKIENAKRLAVERLIRKSIENGDNALIGVDFDIITFSGNMIGISANGTSVMVEKILSS